MEPCCAKICCGPAGGHVGGCQNYGPLLNPLDTRCRMILRTPKGTRILTTTQVLLACCLKTARSLLPRELKFQAEAIGSYPEGPSTQDLRSLVPKANRGMVSGGRVLKYWVLGYLDPLGYTCRPVSTVFPCGCQLERKPVKHTFKTSPCG